MKSKEIQERLACQYAALEHAQGLYSLYGTRFYLELVEGTEQEIEQLKDQLFQAVNLELGLSF